MKSRWSIVVALFIAVAFVAGLHAQDKEVTLKGKITCAKCDLKTAKACTTVIVVKEGDKDVVYEFDKESGKKYHKDICTTPKDGSVVGKTSKMKDKHIVTVTKLEWK